jgi:mono/diheme cytochrome c family protein
VRNPMEASQRSLLHGKTVFLTNCIGCHGLQADGKGPASRWVNNPAPRNFTDVSSQLLFSDGEMYDAILFGVDGTAMPAWGDILTVNDIWDVTNFLRTVPNGGINREPTADMMVTSPDYKPIELTPPALLLTPQAPGLGQTGQATPPAPTGTPTR